MVKTIYPGSSPGGARQAVARLGAFVPPVGWDGDLFLLPADDMAFIYDHIVTYRSRSCLELGTGFGATACVIAAALSELGDGRLTTVDRLLYDLVNVNILLDYMEIDRRTVDVVVDELGYN